MVCRNLCQRVYYTIVVGQSHYSGVRDIAEDANVILSLQVCSVNAVDAAKSSPTLWKNVQGKVRAKKN
jgi:Ni,Fe-hydrogenase I small subunit